MRHGKHSTFNIQHPTRKETRLLQGWGLNSKSETRNPKSESEDFLFTLIQEETLTERRSPDPASRDASHQRAGSGDRRSARGTGHR